MLSRAMRISVVGLLTYLVCSRFFTESIGLFPKWFDLLEFLFIPLLLAIAIVLARRGRKQLPRDSLTLISFVLFFGLATLASGLVNLPNVHPPAAYLYAWCFITPPLCGVMISLSGADMEQDLLRTLVILGILQAALVIAWQLPSFLVSDRNPDFITGTFGLNGTQLATFLVLAGSTHATWLGIRGKMRLMWMTGSLYMLLFGLVSFRLGVPALFITIIALIFAWRKSFRWNAGKTFLSAAGIITGSILLFISGSRLFPLLQYDSLIFYADAHHLARTGKGAGYLQSMKLLKEHPEYILAGSGPGTVLSRAFAVFALEPKFAGTGQGVGEYIATWEYPVGRLHPGFTRYIQPVWERDTTLVDRHSGQLAAPSNSVLSLLVETGLAGLLPLLMMNIFLVRFAWKQLIRRQKDRPETIALAGGLFSSGLFVSLIGCVGDFWEVSRVMLPLWISFGVLAAGTRRPGSFTGTEG